MMKITTPKAWVAGCILLAAGIVGACSPAEGPSNGQARFQVRLTDAPGDYEAVWIEVEDVMIKRSDDTSEAGWESLPGVERGHYDLLSLVDGRDTMLVDATIPSGSIHQLRLVLGDENSIVIDGKEMALTTPSAQQSGLKLNIDADVTPGIIYSILLDFDVAKSIVKAGNSGKYILKPVIRAVLDAQGGNLMGTVLPDSVQAAVLAIANGDTLSTFTGETGGFLFQAIEPASYDLHIQPDTASGFLPYDTTGVMVEKGAVTDIGVIELAESAEAAE